MGIFSSLFGKKNSNVNSNESNASTTASQNVSVKTTPVLHLKGIPDEKGLYPSELVMLAVAEKFIVSETNFPAYLNYEYEIPNPSKMLMNLQSRGFVKVGSAKDTLDYFKLTELKDIASLLGINAKGKKADIISQISEFDEEALAQFVKERKWKLTDTGLEALKDNPYIQYFLEKHSYNVTEVGIDIWTVNKEYVKNPKYPYRDLIYRLLNDQRNNAYIAFQKNSTSGDSYCFQYCECYRIMGLFVEEEGKSFINAADLYFQYIYKRINIYAGLQLLMNYKILGNDKIFLNTTAKNYYIDVQLLPFHKKELLRLIDELGIEGNAVRESLVTSFEKAKDTGIMTENEAADFVILELNGEDDQSKELADKLAVKALKKIK